MARVTVEDCVTKIPNRFDLVAIAAQRVRAISAGSALTLERDDDRNPVVALREIAEETVDFGVLEETIVKSLQKHIEIDEPEEEEMDLLAIQQEISGAMEGVGGPEDLSEELIADEDAEKAAPDGTESEPAAEAAPEDTDTGDIKDGEA